MKIWGRMNYIYLNPRILMGQALLLWERRLGERDRERGPGEGERRETKIET